MNSAILVNIIIIMCKYIIKIANWKIKIKKSVKFFIVLALSAFLCIRPSAAKIVGHDSLVMQPESYSVFPVSKNHEYTPRILALFEQGKSLFAQENYAAAAQILQQVVDLSELANHSTQKALALSYLALAYEKLEQWLDAKQAIDEALSILTRLELTSHPEKLMFAQALNTAGLVELKLGHVQKALDNWEQAAIAYQEIGDNIGKLGSQMNQAIALQTLGMYPRSQTILKQVLAELAAEPNSPLKVNSLHQLGIILGATGNLAESRQILEQSLSLSQELNAVETTSAILISLGNLFQNMNQPEAAKLFYQQSEIIAPKLTQKMQANLNLLDLILKQDNLNFDLYTKIKKDLNKLPISNNSCINQIKLANILLNLTEKADYSFLRKDIAEILASAIQTAMTLNSPNSESYGWGTLGKLYEQNKQWLEAEKITEKALLIAQEINALDLSARWQWQLGRILTNQGRKTEAILAYKQAVNTLQKLRADLVTYQNVQFSFTETVEPVYRELVRLLVQEPTNQANLQEARQVIEYLQLAELDNFFREACLKAQPIQIEQIDPSAAVIYPIILADRLAVILALPGANLTYYETQLPETEIWARIEEFQRYLNPAFFERDRLQVSQTLYDWLIRPAETQLAANKIKTLVFVLDSELRNLPMAALYDGQQYLIEKYSLALAPGLQLLNVQPWSQQKLAVLTAGLSEGRENFSPLPAVETELREIAQIFKSNLLLNQKFTSTNLAQKINSLPTPVVHIATHGQFSSDMENTFILTWDGKINVQEFNSILRLREQKFSHPLELLVLSACQTATGDRRAVLGLAGLAVRSGARTTLATLWQVSDRSTADLMIRFYQELASQTTPSKAKALQMAQLALLKNPQFQHPFYWAPFVLLGNWL